MGRVLGLVGHARKYCGDRDGARSAYESAISVEGSRLERGHIFCRWAILEVECHQFEEAVRKACQGVALIEESNPSNRDLARGLLARSIAYCQNDQYEHAERDVRRVLKTLHPKRDKKLHVDAVQILGLILLSGKRTPERIANALEALDEVNEWLRRCRIPLKSIQNAFVLWAKGIAHRLLGSEQRAETLLHRSSKILFELEAYTEWIRVRLELIEIYVHNNKWGLVRITLAEMMEHADDVEVLAALAAFYDAVRSDGVEVTEEILRTVYLRIHGKCRKPPSLGPGDEEPRSEYGW